MDRKTVIAFALSFAIFVAWQKYYLEPGKSAPVAVTTQSTSPNPPSSPTQALAPATLQKTPPSAALRGNAGPDFLPLSTGTGEAKIGSGHRFFVGWELKSYKLNINANAARVDLSSVTHENGEIELAFDDAQYSYLNEVKGQLSSTPQGVLWSYEDAKVKLTRLFTPAPDQLSVQIRIDAQFKAQAPAHAFVSLYSKSILEKDPEAADRQLIYWSASKLERHTVEKEVDLTPIATNVKYIGATNRYFLMSVLAGEGSEPRGLLQSAGPKAGRLSLVYPITAAPGAGTSISIPLKAYFGPKELHALRAVDPLLDHTIDLGWFTLVAYPILKLLKWLYLFIGNYGWSVIVLTLFIKLITYPLTYKSMKSMKEMARIQPQLQKLREKYKDNKEALNREMLSLMRSHGYNPMSGCLPILIQMPVFFALYRVLYSSIELYHAPFIFWIKDLSSHDPFYVTPILLTVTMYLQQKLSPTPAADPAQQKMMQFMPVFFGLLMISLPSGLTLYMLVNAIASIAQQLYLNKKLDLKPRVNTNVVVQAR